MAFFLRLTKWRLEVQVELALAQKEVERVKSAETYAAAKAHRRVSVLNRLLLQIEESIRKLENL